MDRESYQIVNGLRRVVQAIELYSQEVKKSYGLTGPQLWALKTIRRLGNLSSSDLAAALAVQPSSLSVLVDRLERRRLVRRVRPRADKRYVEIELTRLGASTAAKSPEAAQGRLLHGLGRLTPGQRRAIRRSVDKIVAMMEARDLTPRFFFSDD
jgi:DNA-binding MarR family transcriptional regulator